MVPRLELYNGLSGIYLPLQKAILDLYCEIPTSSTSTKDLIREKSSKGLLTLVILLSVSLLQLKSSLIENFAASILENVKKFLKGKVSSFEKLMDESFEKLRNHCLKVDDEAKIAWMKAASIERHEAKTHREDARLTSLEVKGGVARVQTGVTELLIKGESKLLSDHVPKLVN